MSQPVVEVAPEVRQRILRIQALAIVWMIAEMGVALFAAWQTGSLALTAFGGDSAIELISAGIVLWRFRERRVAEATEERAARVAGSLLFVLSAYVLLDSVTALARHQHPEPSPLGIGVLLVAALLMPWIAWRKRRLSADASSAALRADAAESAVCGYMAWIALAGLIANAVWGIGWADPVAALALVPFILREGWESVHGKQCAC